MANKNLVAMRRKERFDNLDKATQRELDIFFTEKASEHQLKVIEKSNLKPAVGDIFVLSSREGIYFYGKVIVANIVRKVPDTFVEGKHVVFIFKGNTQETNLDKYIPDYDNLLIPPAIVSDDYWKKGYFYTIANIPLTEEEKNLDFGFYKIHFKNNFFCKETGEVLEQEPKILGGHGITTITGIATEVERELIIDPTLLAITNEKSSCY
ncbi:hypothetical protein HO839_10430 [Streptococcus suis]|nr:hypothetical protein [Streptococcus suis]